MMTPTAILRVADGLRAAARYQIREGASIPPSVFLFATDNPVTGQPQDQDRPIIPLIQPSEMHRHRFAEMCHGVSIAARAYASIVMFEAWHVKLQKNPPDDAYNKMTLEERVARIRQEIPSVAEHEDRESTIAMMIELGADRTVNASQTYRRDQGQIIFDPIEWTGASRDTRLSPWCMVLPTTFGSPPPDVMASCRNIAAYLVQGVDWLAADFYPVMPDDEKAQAGRG